MDQRSIACSDTRSSMPGSLETSRTRNSAQETAWGRVRGDCLRYAALGQRMVMNSVQIVRQSSDVEAEKQRRASA